MYLKISSCISCIFYIVSITGGRSDQEATYILRRWTPTTLPVSVDNTCRLDNNYIELFFVVNDSRIYSTQSLTKDHSVLSVL